jgi:hypothetical protein
MSETVSTYCVPGIWESDLREYAQQYHALCDQLAQAILHHDSTLDAWFQINDDPCTGMPAREAMSAWLTHTIKDTSDRRYGYLACSPNTLDIAQQYNVAGITFSGAYAALRKEIKDHTGKEDDATTIARQVLGSIGEHHTDLERVRRQAAIAHGTLQHIRWFITQEVKSTRRTLRDAVTALKALSASVNEDRAAIIEHEIDLLTNTHYKPDKPVAVKRKTSVETDRCRAWTWDAKTFEVNAATYSGTLPLLCADTHTVVEKTLPSTIRSKGAGRPSTISNIPVSASLPGWFHYEPSVKADDNQDEGKDGTATKKRHASPTMKTQIPHAKIFLKKEGGLYRPYLCYTYQQKRILVALNMTRYESCWLGLASRAKDAGETVKPEEWLQQCPSKEDVDQWLVAATGTTAELA